MRSKVKTYDDIYNLLQNRLNQVGEITTNDAWRICKYSYGTTAQAFRGVMEVMVHKGYAEKIVNGRWRILKPNMLKK